MFSGPEEPITEEIRDLVDASPEDKIFDWSKADWKAHTNECHFCHVEIKSISFFSRAGNP